jgi:hypothetical protein
MMKHIHILFFLLATLMSCNKSNENSQIQDLLIGQWKLTSFVDELSGTSINATDPNYFDPMDNTEVLININFNENFDFEGSTRRNSFSNTYTLNNSETVIIFNDMSSTEAGETNFGTLFFDNLLLNYNQQTQNIESSFELNATILKLYYSENEYMEFERM